MLQQAKIRDTNSKINYLQADMQNLPFQDNSFDVISAITSLEFVQDINQAINEAKRVLKPKGYLLVAVLNQSSQLGISKDSDPIYSKAKFFTNEKILDMLKPLKVINIKGSVLLNNKRQVLDFNQKIEQSILDKKGAFIIALAQKEKS